MERAPQQETSLISQDERNLAGAAHLGVFVPNIGFLVVIGLWIYTHTRKPRQEYASFQSGQAVLLQVLTMILVVLLVGMLFLFALGFFTISSVSQNGQPSDQAFGGGIAILVVLFVIALLVLTVFIYGYAIYLAVRSFQGRDVRIPLLASLAGAISPPPASGYTDPRMETT